MLLSHWYPAYDVDKVLDEMDRFFTTSHRPLGLRSVPRGTFPAINVYDQEGRSVVVAEVPGVEPENLEVSVLNDTVTLSGDRSDAADADGQIYRQERPLGRFSRTITLPDAVNPDTVRAEYRHGVLRVSLEKADEAKPRQIEVQAQN